MAALICLSQPAFSRQANSSPSGDLADASAAQTTLRLCGGRQVREGHIEGNRFITTWYWRAEASAGLPKDLALSFQTIDDCKPSLDGRTLLVSASSGAIAVVAYPSGKTIFYAHVPNAHSIETLPDGIVAAASSTNPKGNQLLFFNLSTPDKPIASLPLKAAHGVTYDPQRNVLWALGDEYLLRLSIKRTGPDSINIHEDHRYPLGTAGGHDLVLSHDGSTLFITTSPGVMVFDIATGKLAPYAPLLGLKNVKSLSINPSTGQLAYTQADPRCWWTYTLRFQHPDETVTLDASTYKLRWSKR